MTVVSDSLSRSTAVKRSSFTSRHFHLGRDGPVWVSTYVSRSNKIGGKETRQECGAPQSCTQRRATKIQRHIGLGNRFPACDSRLPLSIRHCRRSLACAKFGGWCLFPVKRRVLRCICGRQIGREVGRPAHARKYTPGFGPARRMARRTTRAAAPSAQVTQSLISERILVDRRYQYLRVRRT